jgi:ABC-2 type transport system ATP-binding protein
MSSIISVRNLRKTYGKTVAVDDISFDVAEGEIFGLLGPNGAGKTTTVECLQAAPEPLDWRVLIEQWGLAEKRQAGFSSLSGGQRQRLFIALALVNNPRVVFLDEMTAGLDPAARHVAWDLIKAIRDNGTTVVLVTHFMDEAENLCDRVAVVDRGKIVASDTPQGLIARHTSEVLVIFTTDQPDLAWLEKVAGVTGVVRKGPRVEVSGSGPVLALTAAALVEHGIVPADLRVEQPTLEDVFLKLTGRTVGE